MLVIDDNSPDGTGRVVDELAAKDPRIKPYHRPGKLGLGTAIVAAMRYAMANGYDYLLNMDADFSHPPRYLPALLAGMDTTGRDDRLAVRRPAGGRENWPWAARDDQPGGQRAGPVPLPDAACGTPAGRSAATAWRSCRTCGSTGCVSRGYSFQQEVLYRCRLAGCRLGETPIIFENRRAGQVEGEPEGGGPVVPDDPATSGCGPCWGWSGGGRESSPLPASGRGAGGERLGFPRADALTSPL